MRNEKADFTTCWLYDLGQVISLNLHLPYLLRIRIVSLHVVVVKMD